MLEETIRTSKDRRDRVSEGKHRVEFHLGESLGKEDRRQPAQRGLTQIASVQRIAPDLAEE